MPVSANLADPPARKRTSTGSFLSLPDLIISCSARVSLFATDTQLLCPWALDDDKLRSPSHHKCQQAGTYLSRWPSPGPQPLFSWHLGLAHSEQLGVAAGQDKETWPSCNFLVFCTSHSAQLINKQLPRVLLNSFFKPPWEPLYHSEGMSNGNKLKNVQKNTGGNLQPIWFKWTHTLEKTLRIKRKRTFWNWHAIIRKYMLFYGIVKNNVANANIAFSVPGKSQMSIQRTAKQFGVFYFNSIATGC